MKYPDVTLPVSGSAHGLDRDITDRQARAKEGHGAGRRVGKLVGQQVQEFLEMPCTRCTESGGQILDRVTGHPRGQLVIDGITDSACQ